MEHWPSWRAGVPSLGRKPQDERRQPLRTDCGPRDEGVSLLRIPGQQPQLFPSFSHLFPRSMRRASRFVWRDSVFACSKTDLIEVVHCLYLSNRLPLFSEPHHPQPHARCPLRCAARAARGDTAATQAFIGGAPFGIGNVSRLPQGWCRCGPARRDPPCWNLLCAPALDYEPRCVEVGIGRENRSSKSGDPPRTNQRREHSQKGLRPADARWAASAATAGQDDGPRERKGNGDDISERGH